MFKHEQVASWIWRDAQNGDVRIAITRTEHDDYGKPRIKYQGVCTSIVRTTLQGCLDALQASFEREAAKNDEERAADAWVEQMAERRYQSQMAYACGERD